jgi:hypothetical protein
MSNLFFLRKIVLGFSHLKFGFDLSNLELICLPAGRQGFCYLKIFISNIFSNTPLYKTLLPSPPLPVFL